MEITAIKKIVLQIQGDLTTAPTGMYVDGYSVYFNQSYVTPKAGYVLFEKVAETLEEQNATVFREYSLQLKKVDQAISISIIVEEFELHQWKTRQNQPLQIARAKVTYTAMAENMDVVQETVELKAKVTSENDAFKTLARQFCNKIAQHAKRRS